VRRYRNDWPSVSVFEHGQDEDVEVGIVDGVDDDERSVGHRGEDLGDPLRPPNRTSSRVMLCTCSGRMVPPLFSATNSRRLDEEKPKVASRANSVSPTGRGSPPTRAQCTSPAVNRPASR
jgi:hypothetical protein